MMLSWQSKSEHGCFTDKNIESDFVLSDQGIPRRVTKTEKEVGIMSSGETCLPHFTSVALSALAVTWDYLEENCN